MDIQENRKEYIFNSFEKGENMDSKLVWKYIKSDIFRYTGELTFSSIIRAYTRIPVVRFQVALRLRQGGGKYALVGRILWFFNRTKQYVVIPPQTSIGYGLYIGHGGPIVVNSTAVIGNNVNLSPFTTIGATGKNPKAATIGDNTYIEPNCCLVENVIIGKNVTIGAGAVVTKDIPDNATAVGNYAKVINYNDPGKRTHNNRWEELDE